MPYTMEDFRREYAKEIEDDRRELAKEILKILPPEERLKGLSAEEIERYLRRLKANTSSGDTSSA